MDITFDIILLLPKNDKINKKTYLNFIKDQTLFLNGSSGHIKECFFYREQCKN